MTLLQYVRYWIAVGRNCCGSVSVVEAAGHRVAPERFWKLTGSQLIGRLSFLEYLILEVSETHRSSSISYESSGSQTRQNSLTVIPENMGFLIYLRHLDISYNNLRILPVSITNLKPFELLDLSNNNLCSLSQSQSSWAAFYDPDWNNSQKCSNIIVQEK